MKETPFPGLVEYLTIDSIYIANVYDSAIDFIYIKVYIQYKWK